MQKEVEEYQLTKVKISDLKPDPDNPNKLSKEQEKALRTAIQRFGYLVPIIINENYEVGDGSHRIEVYKELGIKEIPAYIVPKINDDIERRLLRQTMNKLRGEHEIKLDADEIALIFQNDKLDNLAELIATERESLENILTKHKGIEFQREDNFDVDKALEDLVPTTKLGDIWQLGQHRIICADCTDKRLTDKLLEGKKVNQLNTDPPYGVLYGEKNADLNARDGGNRIQEQYENDEINFDYHEMFNSIFQNIPFEDYNTIYIWSGDQHLHELRQAVDDNDIHFANYLIWLKNNHVTSGGRKDYDSKHEYCIYGWKGKHEFYGPFRTTILEYDKPLTSRLHPTMKPIPMLSQLIQDGSKAEDIIFDPFLGSGSTLIACEQTNRVCYGVEIDCHYTDVCVKRWEAFTGKKAVKLSSHEGGE